jgi:hypothetical protein
MTESEMELRLKKPGWQTSEFWVTLAAIGAPFMGLPVDLMTGIVAAAYTMSRGIYKAVSGK